MIAGLLDHLWQSSLFAGAAGLLTLALRGNAAGLPFQLWFAASLKLLLPFAGPAALGEGLSRLLSPALPRVVLAIQPAV
jgi:bla regulator protein blaR1